MKISSLIETAYNLPDKACVLECGACEPQHVETKSWINKHDVYLLEPNLESYQKLKELNYNAFNLALSDNNEKQTFYISKHTGFCYLESSDLNDSKKNNEHPIKSYQVECLTYENLQKKLDIIFDIFILDIEGQEDKVLKSLLKLEKKSLPKILCVECGYEWENRKELCKELGYSLDFYYYNNCYFSLGNAFAKNPKIINSYNESWPHWNWEGKRIYDNENTNI